MSNPKNNQARGHWVPQDPSLTKKYQVTNFSRKKSADRIERQSLVKKAMSADPTPTVKELARRFMVAEQTIKSDLKVIGGQDV
jgi:hypothetical protein